VKWFVFLIVIGLSDHCYAQLVWTITDSIPPERNTYFTALSCYGNECIVAGLKDDNAASHLTSLVFIRSRDGGRSWNSTDPGVRRSYGHYQHIESLQEIDSLNIVAVGDTALIVISRDGGLTWNRANVNSTSRFVSVHFADRSNGIVVGDRPSVILTTSDGGQSWQESTLRPPDPYACRCFGPGLFAVFSYGWGPLYYTSDGWHTVDSTAELIDTVAGCEDILVYSACTFLGRDTVVAYGNRLIIRDSLLIGARSLLSTSFDRGRSWLGPYTDTSIRTISTVSSVGGDTLYACSSRTGTAVLRSVDAGLSWTKDTLVFQGNPIVSAVNDIRRTSSGNFVGMFAQYIFDGSMLGIGRESLARVDVFERIVYGTNFFPNPASTMIRIHSIVGRCQCQLVDILGRTVASVSLDGEGNAVFNLSNLTTGFYSPSLLIGGRIIPLKPIMVVRP
jgi:photosystem II stability/assembly factor-like uncharacterized protein